MIISVHVPKCAGTSFRHVLAELYGSRLWLNYGTIFNREQFRADLVAPEVQCIHGHFFADAFDGLCAQRRLITWVRHPVDRVVSNYYHFLRSPDMRDSCCRILHERRLSLREFAALDWMRNEATRYLAHKMVGEFAFVGIAERFEESLRIFGDEIGWLGTLEAPCVNTNPDRTTPNYDLSTEDYDYILGLNTSDFAWYSEALLRLDSRVADVATLVA
jgi:hypothetical protein